jgi:putative protein-disulfide isomerase
MKKPLLIYCYDAYCGWCYGFSPVLKKIHVACHSFLDTEVLSGGMIISDKPFSIEKVAELIAGAYTTVEKTTGVKFGEDYLWHIFNSGLSDWFLSSEKPAIAMCVFKQYHPDRSFEFASDLQYAMMFEGRDLTDHEAYRHLLKKYEIPADEFYEKIVSLDYRKMAYDEFEIVKKLQITGFPALLLQTSDSKFYHISKGYTDFETIFARINNVLEEIKSES